jgi:hypothetical protein
LQTLPLLQLIGVWLHPRTGSQLSVVHGLLSLQFSGVPATQPVAGLQLPIPLHTLLPLHCRGVPVHVPLVHTLSPVVQALLSLQAVPFSGVGLLTHPATGSQLSAVHGLLSLQFSGVPATHPVAGLQVAPLQTLPLLQSIGAPAQVPVVHTSFCVHALLSLHAVPFATGVPMQVPFVHTPFC